MSIGVGADRRQAAALKDPRRVLGYAGGHELAPARGNPETGWKALATELKSEIAFSVPIVADEASRRRS